MVLEVNQEVHTFRLLDHQHFHATILFLLSILQLLL